MNIPSYHISCESLLELKVCISKVLQALTTVMFSCSRNSNGSKHEALRQYNLRLPSQLSALFLQRVMDTSWRFLARL